MKITARTYLILALGSLFVAAGCKKPGPIELNTGQTALQLTVAPSSTTRLLTTADIDTFGYFPDIEESATSHLLLEAADFDAVSSHHEAILARALFLNPNARLVFPRDTLYRTLDAGTIALDLLVLRKIDKRYFGIISRFDTLRGDSARIDTVRTDTLAGSQYVLYAVDGIGGGGISYDDGRVYSWTASGSASTPRFTAPMTAPAQIHITRPSVGDINSVSTNITVRWTGGGDTVNILAREWDGVKPGTQTYRFPTLIRAGGQFVIVRSAFAALPIKQGKFLLTVSSSSTASVRPTGFTAPILVQTVTSHNLVVQVRP